MSRTDIINRVLHDEKFKLECLLHKAGQGSLAGIAVAAVDAASASALLEALQDLLDSVGDAGMDGYVENSLHIDEVTKARAAIASALGADK